MIFFKKKKNKVKPNRKLWIDGWWTRRESWGDFPELGDIDWHSGYVTSCIVVGSAVRRFLSFQSIREIEAKGNIGGDNVLPENIVIRRPRVLSQRCFNIL